MPSLEAAEAIAEKIHTAVRMPLELPTGEVVLTLSIGVTLIHKGESIDAVVERADQAMYQAKQHGRDLVICFSRSPCLERLPITPSADRSRR